MYAGISPASLGHTTKHRKGDKIYASQKMEYPMGYHEDTCLWFFVSYISGRLSFMASGM